MVLQCAFRNCNNKSYRWAPQSFHRFPLQEPERNQLWQLAAGLDSRTPAETVLKLRICSDHFRKEDFEKPRSLKDHAFLKTNAVPAVFPDAQMTDTATDEQELEEMSHLPQSTPKKDTSGPLSSSAECSGALKLFITTPEQAEPRPPKRRSAFGFYFALRPFLHRQIEDIHSAASGQLKEIQLPSSQEDKIVAEDDNPLNQSMSSVEASSSHPVDSSFVPLSNTSSSSSSDIPSAAGAKNWSENKWIVNESRLMQLFTTCHQCGVFIEEEDKKVTTAGTRIHIKWSCVNGHSGEWDSCPQRVLERRQDPTVKLADSKSYIQSSPTLPANIANIPRPDKSQCISEHVSRFKI